MTPQEVIAQAQEAARKAVPHIGGFSYSDGYVVRDYRLPYGKDVVWRGHPDCPYLYHEALQRIKDEAAAAAILAAAKEDRA
jgi:hypothetical protein